MFLFSNKNACLTFVILGSTLYM